MSNIIGLNLASYCPSQGMYKIDLKLGKSLEVYNRTGDFSLVKDYLDAHPENLVLGKAIALAYHKTFNKNPILAETLLNQVGERNYGVILEHLADNDPRFHFSNILKKEPGFYDSFAASNKNIREKIASLGGNENAHAGHVHHFNNFRHILKTDQIGIFGHPSSSVHPALDNIGAIVDTATLKEDQVIYFKNTLINYPNPITTSVIQATREKTEIAFDKIKIIATECTTLRSIHPALREDFLKNPDPENLVEAVSDQILTSKIMNYTKDKSFVALSRLKKTGINPSLEIHISMDVEYMDESFLKKQMESAIKDVSKKYNFVTENGIPLMEPNVTFNTFATELVPYHSFEFASNIISKTYE